MIAVGKTMTIDEQLSIEGTVRLAFEVRRGESTEDAAKRAITSAEAIRVRFAARVLLNDPKRPDPWDRYRAAAKILGWTPEQATREFVSAQSSQIRAMYEAQERAELDAAAAKEWS